MRSFAASCSACASSASPPPIFSSSARAPCASPRDSARVVLERRAQLRLGAGGVAAAQQLLALLCQPVRLARQHPCEEAPHVGLRLRADELGDDRAVAHADHRGDAAHAVALRRLRSGVDVQLGQHERAGVLGGQPLEQRAERAAGAAPGRPEVDDDRRRARALDHLAREIAVADVDREAGGIHGVGPISARRAPRASAPARRWCRAR
jgi:hypothetical protein